MILKSTSESFKAIYFIIALTALGSELAIFTTSREVVLPLIRTEKLATIDALIRSHAGDLLLQRPRPIRDALISQGIVKNDLEIDYFLPPEPRYQSYLADCRTRFASGCFSAGETVFFDEVASGHAGRYIFVLKRDFSAADFKYLVWEILGMLFPAFGLLLIAISIRKRELELKSRLTGALSLLTEVRKSFQLAEPYEDEFSFLQGATQNLIESRKSLSQVIEYYKADFEKKTRLEQFGLTIGQITHDLKAPLNETENFLIALPILLEKAQPSDITKATESLLNRVRRGKRAFEEALQLTREISTQKEDIHIDQLLAEIKARATANSRLADLQIHVSSSQNVVTRGDSERLQTAILNLIENSAEEKENARITIDVQQNSRASATILLSDDGPGIQEDRLERIFRPLVSFRGNGTGLGLPSSREILAQHGATIRALKCESGALFEIVLPCQEVSPCFN